MQISTSLLFDRASAQMSALQNDLAKSQAQTSTQKQVLTPSDAPDQAAVITRLKSLIGKQDSYAKTLDSVQARLNNEGTTLSSASDILIRIKELAIQVNNGTNGTIGRTVIATEMKGLRDQLLSLANTTDATGNYVFSGTKVRTAAFLEEADGTVRTDSDGVSTGTGFFQALDDLIAGVKAADATVMQRGLTEVDGLHQGVVLAQANSGTDMKVVEQQGTSLEETKLTLITALSSIEDLDMAKAITQMQKQMLSLEAAQSSFAKISQMSLFAYLK